MRDSADRLFKRSHGERETRRPLSRTFETVLGIPRDIDIERFAVHLGNPVQKSGEVVRTAHVSHDHGAHAHGHSKAPASHRPERMLSNDERRREGRRGALWIPLATLVFALDVIFHIAVPGPVDDIVIHGLAILIAGKAARGLNAYWRGYAMPGKDVNTSNLVAELRQAWKDTKGKGMKAFIKRGIVIVTKYGPVETKRERYRGEGFPTSSVTYAVENLFRGFYAEQSGTMRGRRKRVMSGLVLGTTFVSYTVGTALRWGIMKNFHSAGDGIFKKLSFIKPAWLRWVIAGSLTLAVGVVRAPFYALDGALLGLARYAREMWDGFFARKKSSGDPTVQPA